MRTRPGYAWPLGAALALHLALAALIAATPPRRLLPAPEPAAVELVAIPAPQAPPAPEMPLAGAADLQEAVAGPVAWPLPLPVPARAPRPAPAPRPAASALPAAPGPAAAAPTPSPGASQDEIAAWQAALSAWVERHRRYPPAARFRQEEGVVRVRFELDAAGQVRHVALETPSGFPALDAAALALLTGATLPAPPAGMNPARRSVSLPIRYRLE
jgi:protein TonB